MIESRKQSRPGRRNLTNTYVKFSPSALHCCLGLGVNKRLRDPLAGPFRLMVLLHDVQFSQKSDSEPARAWLFAVLRLIISLENKNFGLENQDFMS